MISIFIPSSGTIDISENEAFPITWNIADIRNPDKRNASYTKTLRIPGTANNNRLFGWLFDVNVTANRFNPNRKVNCVVLNDTIPILEGNIQLLSIDVKDRSDVVYECSVMGNIIDLFTNIGDKELRELDFSEYDHTLRYSTLSTSWSASPGSGYVYPMIDYGKSDHANWNIEDFFPAIYAKTYLDKIVQAAGYTHSSTFLNSDFFKRMIIPFNGDSLKLTDQEIQNRFLYTMRVASNQTFNCGTNVSSLGSNTLINNIEFFDGYSQYDQGTGFITINKSGYYNFEFLARYQLQFLDTTQLSNVQIVWQIVKANPNTANVVIGANAQYGVLNVTNPSIEFQLPTSPTVGQYTSQISSLVKVDNVFLNAGDRIILLMSGTVATPHGSFNVEYQTFSYLKMTAANVKVLNGDPVLMNSAVPDKIKQKDFLMGLINLFNLYIDVDKSNPKRLLIEPRNDFYSSGSIVDWSSKWDIENGWNIEPMGALDAIKYVYTYKKDTDHYNDLYNKKFERVYGDREWDVDNDYIKQTKKTEVVFSPTPLVNRGGYDRELPTILKFDNSGNPQFTKHNIRILYWGGTKSTVVQWNLKSVSGASLATLSTFPYAGHLDDPDYPSIDISFGVPRELFYTFNPAIYTNNNLFNRFYKNFIDEITDENSKIVKGKFYLNPYDLQSFDFRDSVYVDNAYWRVNKIEFDPTKDDLASVEMVKIKNLPTFSPSSGTIYGNSSGAIFDFEVTPALRTSQRTNDNRYNEDHLVRGYNVFVADNAINVIATGTDLSIGGSKNVTVLNSSGVSVVGGLTNVHVVNSSGITVTESNVSYVNSVKVSQQGVNPAQLLYTSGVITSAQINSSYTSPITLIPAVAGYIIEPIDCVMYCDYLSGAHTLTASDTLDIDWSSNVVGGIPIYRVASQNPNDFPLLGENSADRYCRLVPVSENSSPAYQVRAYVNNSIVMRTNIANPTGGNILLNYHITYRLIGF